MRKTSESVWDEAAQWYARVHTPDCTGRDREEFEAWLRSNSEHWRAYAEAERVARRFDQLLESDSQLRGLADAAYADGAVAAPPPGGRRAFPTALAASLVAGLLGYQLFHHLSDADVSLTNYATSAIQQRDITLEDQSLVHLDVGSEITVAMNGESRQVTLTRGRALFEVAKDAHRPFTVTAGGTQTTALGTRFQVQRDEARVVVLLTEGSVAVASANAWEERLKPGEQLSLSDARALPVKQRVDASIATSWSRGRLVFRGTPLGEAIDEVNRYATRKIRLADSTLAQLPVAGNFIAGDSELIVSAFTAALPLRSVEGGGGEILLFRRYESDSP